MCLGADIKTCHGPEGDRVDIGVDEGGGRGDSLGDNPPFSRRPRLVYPLLARVNQSE